MPSLTTLRIAMRNLGRNKRRTALVLCAIGFAQMIVITYDGLLRGEERFYVDAITGPLLGHVQAHAPKFRRERAMDLTLDRARERLAELRVDPSLENVLGRVVAPVLAAVGEEGQTAMVMGVDEVSEGRTGGLLEGMGEVALGGRRVQVGRILAHSMGLKLGDALALVGQAADGSMANDLFTVSGFLDTPVDLVNRSGLILSLADAQELFVLPDQVHEVVMRAKPGVDVAALANRLARSGPLAGAEVLDWKRLAPDLDAMIQVLDWAGLFILVLVLLAAATGVANTMMMATFERAHELGMLLALGTRPGRLVRMVLSESVVLGLLGAAAGTLLGLLIVAVTARTGIDLGAAGGQSGAQLSAFGLRVTMRFYPEARLSDVVQTLAAVALVSLLAALWPAIHAARMQPVEAMRS